MGYLAFQDLGGAAGAAAVAAKAPLADPGRLTALEWSVVRLARRDRPSTLRVTGRWTRLLRALLHRRNPKLADGRLEALRRMAVLAWHDGYTVPTHELRAFFAAGFSPRQYETMVDHIGAARSLPPRTVVGA